MTKALAEKLVLRNPNNVVCRYGNVLGSRGSVLPQFVKWVSTGEPCQITDKRMTRFFIPITTAAAFVLKKALGKKGGLYYPHMDACKVTTLAELIGEHLGKPVTFQEVGIRPGEKLHESIDSRITSLFQTTLTPRATMRETLEAVL
jgi:UDP-N-acetylglucosamine 4,6-dehydratase